MIPRIKDEVLRQVRADGPRNLTGLRFNCREQLAGYSEMGSWEQESYLLRAVTQLIVERQLDLSSLDMVVTSPWMGRTEEHPEGQM